MSESRKDWKQEYSKISSDQTYKPDVISPENFVDDIKLNYIRKYLPESGIIVEIGAGSGRLLTRIGLENKNISIIGIDFESYKMVRDNIIKFNLNGTSIQADAFKIPLKSNSVEAVISGGFLEHFNEEELEKLLKEMKRILKPNGLFYAEIVPKKFSLCRPIILTEMGGYESTFDKKKWNEILKNSGYSDIKVVSGLVIPPNFYVWFRSGILLEITNKLKYIIKHMDNTIISDIFGFSYYLIAYKEKLKW